MKNGEEIEKEIMWLLNQNKKHAKKRKKLKIRIISNLARIETLEWLTLNEK